MQVVFSPGTEIKFEGANNFRELGGYRAADGRQVKYCSTAAATLIC